MLENLIGKRGFPSPELIRDLRTLFSLEPAELEAIARVFTSLPNEITTETMSKVMHDQFRDSKTDPEKLSTSLRVVLFVFQNWEHLRLTKAQVASDLTGLGIDSKNAQILLDAMEEKIASFSRDQREGRALATGTPSIESALCVVDGRAVFRASKFDESLGDDQPYLQLDRFVTIVILEIVSELNDEKRTQSYLLTEETLDQLSEILTRAKKRLNSVKAALPK